MTEPGANPLSGRKACFIILVGAISFHVAYLIPLAACAVFAYLVCAALLTRMTTPRGAFYSGLALGLLTFGPQMNFLWTIFGAAAMCLWCIIACWTGAFVLLGHLVQRRFGNMIGILLLPFLWTGLEYFRSELYYLRFSWLNPGFAFSSNLAWLPISSLGMYGIGFVLMCVVSLCLLLPRRAQAYVAFAMILYLGVFTDLKPPRQLNSSALPSDLHIAGMQIEFPSELEAFVGLEKLAHTYPLAQILVLSEYTFQGPVPERIKNWCRENHRYLIVGGEDPAPNDKYFNTAFVIGPDGAIVFKQAKSVPIQFFKDGLPATEQKLWHSPWGKIGLCICYDLSYSRVTDELIRQGAQALIVPTMDVVDWGKHQHELHARVALMRAAEYGVPIFRLASSGISQCVSSTGRQLESAPFAAEGAIMYATLNLPVYGTLPCDRILAPISVGVTALAALGCLFACLFLRKSPIAKPIQL